MTPCEEKGYKVGQVFKNLGSGCFKEGAYIVLIDDDGTVRPCFDGVECKSTDGTGDSYAYCNIDQLTRIYPPEEKKVETIELMGKTYNKAEIEKALSNVMPV